MIGQVFQRSEEQTDRMQFKNTKDELQAYVKKHRKNVVESAPLFALYMSMPQVTMATDQG